MSMLDLILSGIRRSLRRYVGLVMLLSLGGAILTLGAALGSVAGDRASAAIDDGPALRAVTVYAQERLLDEHAVDEIRRLPGVESAHPILGVPVGLEPGRVSLTLLPWSTSMGVPLLNGAKIDSLAENEIVVPAAAEGQDLSELRSRPARLTYTVGQTESSGVTKEQTVDVVAISDPTYQVDAANAAYANPALVLRLAAARVGVPQADFLSAQGYEKILVLARSQDEVGDVLSGLQRAGFQAVSQQQQLGDVPGAVRLIRLVSGVLLGALVLVSAIALSALAQGVVNARRRDVGVMKALGWSSRRIQSVSVAEVLVCCVASQVVGLLLGIIALPVVHQYLRHALGGGLAGDPVIPWVTVIVGNLAALVLFAVIVGVAVRGVARLGAVQILRNS